MTSMTTFTIEILYNDKSIKEDNSGPYYGDYLDHSEALKKMKEIEKDPNVFMVRIKHQTAMG